jgi:type IV fimbrial biogenesis protein FimT
MRRASSRGFTLVELMVAITILAILVLAGVPGFTAWLQNTQIRTAAEAIQSGLQLARSQAVTRNAPVRFQLMSTLDNSCALSTTASNWVVSQDSAVGACATAASDTTAPRIVQARPARDGSRNAVVAASQSSVVFNGLGRISPASTVTIDISNPTGGTCASASGPMRCLQVTVSPTGQVRMCDPQFDSTDAQGCP